MTPQVNGHPVEALAQTWPAGHWASVAQPMVVGAAVTHPSAQPRAHNGRHVPLPQLPQLVPTAVHVGKLGVVVLVVLTVVTVVVDVVGVQSTVVAQLPQAVQHFS
jgi:hypothetical protein